MLKNLNNYQIVVILWGAICFLGFASSQFFPFLIEINSIFGDSRFSLFGWLILTAIGLFYQAKLMWYPNFASIASQVIWGMVGIGGWIFTYFKLYGYFQSQIKPDSGWLFLCAVAMIFTAIVNKNNLSYYFLASLYLIFGVLIQMTKLPFELVIVGTIFLILGITDAYLEHSPWRKGLAEV